jgi:hypothetical protein
MLATHVDAAENVKLVAVLQDRLEGLRETGETLLGTVESENVWRS